MKEICIEEWSRRDSYDNFIAYSDPIFSITARLDVSGLYSNTRQSGNSFFISFLHVLMTSLNGIEEFRTRTRADRVIVHDVVHPSFIVMKVDGSINTCRTAYDSDFGSFYRTAKADVESERATVTHHKFNNGEDDVVYISNLPWIDVVSVKDPYNYDDRDSLSIPRISWGKVVEYEGVHSMTVHVSAHHALVDGYHVCKLIQSVEKSCQ